MPDIKILHIADTHFDRKISHLPPDKADVRRTETLLTFGKIIDRFSDVDIALIAGDMFDGETSLSTVEYLCSVFKQYKSIRFFISCGNHDCLGENSINLLLDKIPDNVYVFRDKIDCVSLPDFGVNIYGVSFSAVNSFASLLAGFSADNPDMINLMVMHGDVGGESSYNPIAISEISDSNLDYIALGHIHSFSGFLKRGNTMYAYPGVPEPCGFDEVGSCGVIYGKISKDVNTLEFYPMSQREYHIINFNISEYNSNEEVIAAIEPLLTEKNLYRINLVGKKGRWIIKPAVYKHILKAFYIEINDLTDNLSNIMDYTDELSLRGKTAHYLKLAKDQVEYEVYKEACNIVTEFMCRE